MKLPLTSKFIAAPMAGLSLPAFRKLVMELGCGLAYSEMVSAEGVIYSNAKTKRYYENSVGARPYGVQIFTAKPKFLAKAIERVDGDSIDCFDINMGCPVKKVVKKGAGAALMKDPELAGELVAAARRTTGKPITVKVRAGWDEASINCVEMARIAEANGADAVIVHPRTKAQEFRGQANWELIGDVKRAVNIPVIGNGDIRTAEDARRMMTETGCDAVMIGRAAYRNPWIFTEATCPEPVEGPTPEAKKAFVIRYIELLKETGDERTSIYTMRTFLPLFAKGHQGVSKFMVKIHGAETVAQLTEAIESFPFVP
jgi:nifR3 family TIM-barrel protein